MNGKKRRKTARQSKREVAGVVLIALGVFFGACLYFEDAVGPVGNAVADFFMGLCGLFSYALPAVLVAGGIAFIVLGKKRPKAGRTSLVLLGLLFVLTLLHVIARPLLGETNLIEYIKDAYLFGQRQGQGGGLLGALLCYPLLLFTGEAGAYIFPIAGIVIILLVVTRLSLRHAGEQVGQTVKKSIQTVSSRYQANRERHLYTEAIHKEPAAASQDAMEIDFMPLAGPIERRRQQAAPEVLEPEWGTDTPPWVDPNHAMPESGGENESPLWRKRRVEQRKTQEELQPLQEDAFVSSMQKEAAKQDAPAGKILEQANNLEERPYQYPPTTLLSRPGISSRRSTESPHGKGKLLVDTLASFNVAAKIVNITVGPVVTRFELQPAPGVRVNRITALSDDIALALAAPRVRMEAPIPGKAAVGIEIPNKDTAMVVLRDIIESKEFRSAKSDLTMALGKDIAGKVIVADLGKMPHMLIAGATGSGKSVCINDIVISLAYKSSPKEVKMILIDPKVVELSGFNVLPHLQVPVVTEPKKAAGALRGAVNEMVLRYQKFSKVGARDLARYNKLQPEEHQLPKLVIIIDELADLMMVAPDEVEDSICRIAQLGRASGIHLIVATQRPSADVITGLIKANIPTRIAFAVSSGIDSRIILDLTGAEKLLGKGDMLFHPNGANKPTRVQGAYVSDQDVENLLEFFTQQQLAQDFDTQLMEEMDQDPARKAAKSSSDVNEDELLGEAVRIILDSGQASISMIQRRLRVGYARAARLVDMMEQRGYVSGFDGSKPRKVLIKRGEYQALFECGEEELDED